MYKTVSENRANLGFYFHKNFFTLFHMLHIILRMKQACRGGGVES